MIAISFQSPIEDPGAAVSDIFLFHAPYVEIENETGD